MSETGKLGQRPPGGIEISQEEQNKLRRYLLGKLSEAEVDQVERRLLSDEDYLEQLEIIENELIDQYAQDRLPADEREQFEQHFLRAPERQHKLAFALALDEESTSRAAAMEKKITPLTPKSPARQPAFFSSIYFKIAATVVVAVGLGYVIWLLMARQSDVDRGMLALNEAYKKERLVEARISGLNYAPTRELRGGAQPDVDGSSRDRAERLLLDAVHDHPNPASYHALGRLYLAERRFDKAKEQFDVALSKAQDNAQLHSDMGAALLELGKNERSNDAGKSLQYFAQSLEHLNRALELNDSLPEALFNRALVYQQMMLPQQAKDDWQKYIERDPTSHWADEARQHLKLLEQEKTQTSQDKEQSLQNFLNAYQARDDDTAWQIVSRNHSSAGNLITNALLDSYLELETKGRYDEAQGQLQALFYVGQLELQKTGDRYTSDLARFYDSAPRTRLEALAQARSRMKKAYELFTGSNFPDAIAAYTAARQIFEQAEDVCESTFVMYRLGHCYVLKLDAGQSQTIFEALSSTCQSKEYGWLLAQCFYELAHIRVSLSEYSKAIDYSNQALKLSEKLEDTNGVLKSLTQLAEEYRSLNNENMSLGFLQRSLISINKSQPEPMQGWATYFALALNFNSLGFYAAALEYQKEALRAALAMNRPLTLSRAYEYLGLIYGNLKNYDEAISNIQRAFEVAKTNGPNGLEMMASAALQMGEVYRQSGDYGQALAAYDESIRLYDGLGFEYFSYPAHKGKLLSHIAQGNDSATAEELRIVLSLFEQYRSKITDASHRNSFFDTEQNVYDLAMDFEYSRMNNPQRAFEYSEVSRARSLLDVTRQGAQVLEKEGVPDLSLRVVSSPLTLPELQQAMPAEVQILQYAVLDDKVLIWVINRSNISEAAVNISARTLREKIQNYLDLVNNESGTKVTETSEAAKDLYNILIQPIETVIDRGELLCIVPDKILNYLPYDALISPASGRYLIEDYRLQISPSSSIFLDCSNRADGKAGARDERLLSVGNPSFAHSSFPALPDLPAASREAQAISFYYKSARLLLGDDARVSQIKRELERADVAHFALHYVVDGRSEMLSKLVLAGESAGATRGAESDGVLQAYEIYKMKLSQTRLVVLSACQTGIERQYGGEGAVGLARPFIAAGVPLVVASLWPVDSNSTAELMIAFHKHRKRDEVSTVEALRHAQLDMLHNPDERYRQPYYWASFVAIGGYTRF